MKPHTLTLIGLLALCLAVPVALAGEPVKTVAQSEEQHPRLFMTPARLAVIRQQAAIKDSHHQLALTQLQAAVAKAEAGDEDEGKYGPGYKAVQLATLCAVAEDPAEKKKYAEAAYKTIIGWTKTGSATLGKSMEASCIALAYDWAYPV